MSDLVRISLVVFVAGSLCGCHGKDLGVSPMTLMDEALPQHYRVAEAPSEAFRTLRQAVADTPQARLVVSDEASGILTWFVLAETKEERKKRKRACVGEPVLTVGSARWVVMRSDGSRVRRDSSEFVICTAGIRPDGSGSRVQIRRAWWANGYLDGGMPQAWVFEAEMLARAGLRVSKVESTE